eukprot:536340_1
MGAPGGDDASSLKDSDNPDVIAIETLMNMRTVASLGLGQIKRKEYLNALRGKQSQGIKTAFMKGATGGMAQFFQLWGLSLLYWWGSFLLYNYPDKWSFQDFLIAIFALMVSISGTALGSSETSDRKSAKKAVNRIFALIDRESQIDPLGDTG